MNKADAAFSAVGWLAVAAMAGGGAVFTAQRHGWAWDTALYAALAGLALGGLSMVAVAWLVSVLWRWARMRAYTRCCGLAMLAPY